MKGATLMTVGVAILIALVAVPVGVWAQGMWGPGGWWGFPGQTQTTGPVTIDQAVNVVQQTLTRLGNPDLVPTEVMEFSSNFYAIVAEKSTGIGAFELIVERTGAVHPEPGPNMMWNAKYGHMAGWGGYGMMGGRGMMGGWSGPGYAPPGPGASGQQLTRDQARQVLQTWLTQAFPGTKAEEGTPFYGYFTFDYDRNGKPVGMASVNAFTGQVWYHTWHGTFIREKHL